MDQWWSKDEIVKKSPVNWWENDEIVQQPEPQKPFNFDRPDQEIRTDIAAQPTDQRDGLISEWAKREIDRERNAGFRDLPNPVRGVPIIGGLLDEGLALADSGLHTITGGLTGRPYDEALALQRERFRRQEEERPALALGGQLTAGLATGGGAFKALQGASTLGKAAAGAVTGYGLGGVEGFTRGEGTQDRINNAQTSANIGAFVGGALPVLGDLAKRGAGLVNEYIAPTVTRYTSGAEKAADKILANRIAREGTSPAAIRADLQKGQANAAVLHGGGKTASKASLPEAIADTSDSMRRLTGSLYRAGGEAGNFIEESLNNRQRGMSALFDKAGSKTQPDGQHQRIMSAAERALLIKRSGTARQTERQITAQMREQGNKLYEAAYKNYDDFDIQGVLDGLSLKSMQYPAPFQAKLQRALNLFTDNSPQRFPVNTMERFDAAKKALDDLIETAQRQGQGNLTRELTAFKNDLLKAVHAPNAAGQPTRNLAYQEAREAWGSAAENKEAIELGRSALRENSEVSIDQYKDLTAGQQQLFRLGFLDSLRNSLAPKSRGHNAAQIFESNRVRELMSEMIPRSKSRKSVYADRTRRFGDYIDREQRMVQTKQAALGNSMTARNQSDDAAFAGEAIQTMWDRFRQSPSLFNMGVEAVSSGLNKVFGYRQDVALALAKRLLETDPIKRNQILRAIRKQSPDKFRAFSDLVDNLQSGITVAAPTQVAERRSE